VGSVFWVCLSRLSTCSVLHGLYMGLSVLMGSVLALGFYRRTENGEILYGWVNPSMSGTRRHSLWGILLIRLLALRLSSGVSGCCVFVLVPVTR